MDLKKYCAVALLVFICTNYVFAELTRQEILDRADERIKQYRMSEVELVILDFNGEPIAEETNVKIEQVRHQFLFGCNLFRYEKMGDAKLDALYKQRYKELFNFATLGFYWGSYEWQQGKTAEEYWKGVAKWCGANGIMTKGHPLFWTIEPRWVNELDESKADELIFGRIAREVKAFDGLIEMWDVLNEPCVGIKQGKERHADTAVRQYELMGTTGVIARAFETARKANPEATLILNDYNTSENYVKVIEDCIKAGVDMNVVGIQSHQHTGYWGAEKTWAVCERFKRFEKPLHFTEVTLVSGPGKWEDWQETTPGGEQKQAKEAVEFYTILFSHPAVEAITWWDFSDKGAWQKAPAGFLRHDMSPKPVYDELIKLIKGKWWTKTTVKVDENRKVKFRGFLGEYKIIVNGSERTFSLTKDKDSIVVSF